jgi:hypothetical protein
METIMFKAPKGTKDKLRRISPNVSALLRQATEELIRRSSRNSAYEKSEHLCGVFKSGPANASTSREYLNQYAPKSSR